METVRLDREISQTTAPSGVIVLSERVASVRSVAVGIWVRSASAHEPRRKMGVSHLLEHMVFKGTERRTAQQIALALESRGGSLDAYTSRDTTAFQARVLDSDLPQALDVLTDLVRNPVLRPSDLELERNVVLEEINTVEDTPDDQVFDLAYQTLWPQHSYGYSILGTRDTVSALSTDDLKQLHGRAYFPANCVIASAGNLTHEQLLEGLAYAIYAFTSFYRQVGVTGVYVGTQPKTATQAAAAIREEYAKLARTGLTGEALADAKQQTQGQLMLSLESPSARMYRLAGFPIHGEPYQSLDQVLAAVAGLTEEEMAGVAAEFFAPERQTVVWLGPEKD